MRPIVVQYRPISKPLQELINEHNDRVVRIWAERGSACRPFQSTPSAVPAASADLSRVPAVEHGGSALKEARA